MCILLVTTSLAIKALSLGLGSILWLLPGSLLTGRGKSIAVLLEVLLTLAFLELSGFIHHQHLMFLFWFPPLLISALNIPQEWSFPSPAY